MREIAFKTFGDIFGFDHAFMDTSYPIKPLWKEDDDKFTLEIVIPGAEKKDIKFERVDDKLILSFKGNEHKGAFQYEYLASEKVLKGERSAKYKNGILSVTVKKVDGYRETTKVE